MQESTLLGGETYQSRTPKIVCLTTREQREMVQEAFIQTLTSLAAPRTVINYIHRGSIDDRHNSKWQRRMLFHTTFVREWINFIQRIFS